MDAPPHAIDELRPLEAPPLPRDVPPLAPAVDHDRALHELADRALAFADTPPHEKAAVLRALVPHLFAAAPELAAEGCRLRGVDAEGSSAAGEWTAGPAALIATARALAGSIDAVARGGRVSLPRGSFRSRADGRVELLLGSAAPVVPGGTVRVLFQPGVAPEHILAERAAATSRPSSAGGVALVVAAGGSACAAPMNALHALFAKHRVALLALPQNRAALAPLLEHAFAPLVERGWLQIVTGGDGQTAASLASHGAVAAVHLDEPAERWRALGIVPADKPIFASPGGASPVIVMPYLYAKDELRFQARSIAASIVHAQALDAELRPTIVLPMAWRQKDMLLDAVRRALASAPSWAPGLLAESVPGLFGLASVGSDDPVEFAAAAVAFCNDTLRGSGCAAIVAPPLYREGGAVAAAVERAVSELRYGAVAVNTWPGALYALAAPPWGAWQGAGASHDATLLTRVDKSIVDAPLRGACKPTFFGAVVPAHARTVGRRLVRYAAAPSLAALGALTFASLRR